MKTRFTELFGVEVPIVQGGLAHLAFSELAAAVSAAGGLGQISAVTVGSPEALRHEIALTRSMTDRPFAVNFALGQRPSEDLIRVAIDERVSAVSITGGNPEPVLNMIRGTGIKSLVLTAGVRQAQKAEELGADAVIAVGFEGGGHIGRDDLGTMVLVPRTVESVRIPVLASGGLADGRGLAAALALGADGIEMGTRFVATQECRAHPNYKKALVELRETDTVVVERSRGRPGRILKGPLAEAILAVEARGGGIEELLPLIRGEINKRAALEGEMDHGWVWAGQSTGLIHDVPTVKELIDGIVSEAEAILRGLCHGLGVRQPC